MGKDQFKGIVAYDRWLELNPVLNKPISSGPNMGLPSIYQIINDPREGSAKYESGAYVNGMQSVHHSRCVRYDRH